MRAVVIAVVGLSTLLAGCRDAAGPGQLGAGTEESARLAVQVSLAGAPEITQVRLRVTAADLADTLRFALAILDGEARGTAVVPAGPQRTFTLQALDAAQVVRYEGSTTVDVVAGTNPPLTIVMMPTEPNGEVPIVGQLGSYTVELVPAADTLVVGESIRLASNVRDPWANTLSNALPAWESSVPTAAAVDANGEVTALAAGRTTITARFAGASASALIDVVGAPPGEPAPSVDTLFVDSFESGALNDAGRWHDIVRSGASIVAASAEGIGAISGTRVLKLAANGVAMTHFVSTGSSSPYERLYLSFRMYRTSAYEAANPGLRAGGIRGSTTQWGSFGVGWGTPGSCPDDPANVNQQEFMFAYVANEGGSWALRTFTNWLGQRKLTEDPPTCGGGYAFGPGNDPEATYHDPGFVPSVGAWHRYEIEVGLNDVGQANGWQRIWVDGVLKIEHLDVEYRTTPDMKLWGVSFDTGVLQAGVLYVDDVIVATRRGS